MPDLIIITVTGEYSRVMTTAKDRSECRSRPATTYTYSQTNRQIYNPRGISPDRQASWLLVTCLLSLYMSKDP